MENEDTIKIEGTNDNDEIQMTDHVQGDEMPGMRLYRFHLMRALKQ